MRKVLFTLFALVFGVPVFAQMGGSGPSTGGGNFDNGMEKLFGGTPVFSATMITTFGDPSSPVTAKAKMIFDHENSWTEMNMADAQGPNLPPQALAQMKSLGMDDVVSIATADKKNAYVIYPHIHSYVAIAIPPPDMTNNDFKVQTTKLGQETMNGHLCVKNDVIITNTAQSNDFTVWNATDLNNFPVKIATSEQGMPVSITFENISFDKPANGLFQPPAHYTRYGSIQDLMQSAMMNNPGSMPGMPSPAPSQSQSP